MTDEPSPDKKIIIDENWKARVEAEREELKKKTDPAQASAAADQGEGDERLPPPSFALLVSTLATQAMTALGQLPDPVEGKAVVRLAYAKHHIDTLEILQQRTRGNLSEDEEQMMEDLLHQLRMMFVAVRQQGESGD